MWFSALTWGTAINASFTLATDETMILFSQISLISSFLKISMEHIVMGIQLWLPITLWNTALIADNPMGIPLYSQGAQLWFPKTLWIIRCGRFSPVSKTLFTARRKLIETGRKKDTQLVGHTRKSPIMWTPTLYLYMYWKLMLLLFCGIFMFIYFWFCESHESCSITRVCHYSILSLTHSFIFRLYFSPHTKLKQFHP